MNTCGGLGIDEISVNRHFVTSVARRDQDDFFDRMTLRDYRLEICDQMFRQTGGSRRVVSSNTEFDGDLHFVLLRR